MLASLREQHRDRVKLAQALLKEQQTIRRALERAMESGPQTVPQLAAAAHIPADQVLWHVTAMKKYGLVQDAGLDEDEAYVLYRLSREVKP